MLSPKRTPSSSEHPPVTQPRNSRIARRKSSSRSSSRRPTGDWAATATGPGSDVYHIEANAHANGGLVNAVNAVSDRMRKRLWVGTLGNPTDGMDDDTRKSVEKRMRVEHDSLPVWIPDAEFSKCYDEFCHQVSPSPRTVACVNAVPGPLAVSALRHPRRAQDQVLLRVRVLGPVLRRQPEVRRRHRGQLPGRRHQ